MHSSSPGTVSVPTRAHSRSPAPRRAAALTCLAVVLPLVGCSSEDEPSAQETPAASPTSPEPGAYWCQSFDPEEVERAVPGGLEDSREVVLEDSSSGYECRVQVHTAGQEPADALRIEIAIDAGEEFDRARTEYVDGEALREDVTTGPPWLGESYLAVDTAIAMAPCTPPGGTGTQAPQVPYMVRVEAPMEGTDLDKDDFTHILTRTMVSLDRTQGCSPSKVAPTDGSAGAPSP